MSMSTPMSAPAKVVEYFEPEDLPVGRITRLLVEIAHDGLSRPIQLPVLVARGAKPGPVFGLTAALHGNELNGIPVIRRLLGRLDPKALRGTVVGVIVVNVPGYLNHTRYFGPWDLNHMFPGHAEGNAASVYVNRLLERLVCKFDFLVDLHTASFGRVNSLYVRADMTNERAARMAYLQRPQIIVHNPPSDRTLRGAAAELGIPAVTVEIGNPHRFHRDYIKRTLTGLRSVLAREKMIRPRAVKLGPPPVLCDRSHWIYTDHGGLLEVFPGVTDRVESGEAVARLTTPFGDLIADYEAPDTGVIVGHSVNPVAETGARILHIGFPVEDGDPRFHQREPVAQDGADPPPTARDSGEG
ncbi:Succinylglutamate desuccinylase / Aspartoacylase family protein [Enhygromyxa salina]|uniref:Succinylglutamate desuccinylase / Aspartoacylase family protein n=1 Tax=Enhygromyxa salina TaxID=215803 RepID=A0A2S9XH60_9BACT|nr:succinylglutamate desuccinylase/aspartoacylase family protein [Enhygromyxa salina]PRP92209.1 Succinylglutamate desuccinylase / Aspartoacylase family protein [Enhygromyxa salina]